MFFYLHFTRAPPRQAQPRASQPIHITPAIMNDLRTESCDLETDIYYAWVKATEPADNGKIAFIPLGAMTPPLKLTTWRKATAYKQVQAFPPKDVKEGDYWQLLLCTKEDNKLIVTVDLTKGDFGAHVLPVLSTPVHFSLKNKGHVGPGPVDGKQVQNERILKFPPLWNSQVGPLRIIEHISYDLDKKVWDSGVGLSCWLINMFIGTLELPTVIRGLMGGESLTILELGAGTGLVSIVLSTLLSHLPAKPLATVAATDLPSAMEILETNISSNDTWLHPIRPQAAVLDWDSEELPEEISNGVDFIIMADVTYNTSSFPSLIQTLQKLSKLRANPPLVLLAYKERDPDERKLWDMALEIGLRFDEIARIIGAGGPPIEIYSGQFGTEEAQSQSTTAQFDV